MPSPQIYGALNTVISQIGEGKLAGYTTTKTDPSQKTSDCISDIVCCQNLLISSTQAFVKEYQDMTNFYYTQLDLEHQALYSIPPDVKTWLALCFASYFGFSIGADTFAVLGMYTRSPTGKEQSITRVMGSDNAIIGSAWVSFWASTYNVQPNGANQTTFRLVPTSQLALDPKCIPEACRCKLGSSGLVDSFTVSLTGELEQVKLNSISSIFIEIAQGILESTVVGGGTVGGDTGILESELMLLSNTLDQLNVNAVCTDCCDKNCVLDFVLLSVSDNKNCCSSVCCPDSCTAAGVSISAVPIPVLALPPDCCPPCSGPTSGPCKSQWDKYVSQLDEHGEPCSAHQDDGPGVIDTFTHTAHDGPHHHIIPTTDAHGAPDLGVQGMTGRFWEKNRRLSEQRDDGVHSHAITNPDGTPLDKHSTPAEFVHDVLNSCLSKCCTYYFASSDGVFKQMGEQYWHPSSCEGLPAYSTTHTKHNNAFGGLKQTGIGLMMWLVAAIKGVEMHPTTKSQPAMVKEDLSGTMITQVGLPLPSAAKKQTDYYISAGLPFHDRTPYAQGYALGDSILKFDQFI